MNQQTVPLENILDECVTAVFGQGQSVTACLRQYPEQRDMLEPLLNLALRLQHARHVRPDPEFRHIAAIRMQNMIAARPRQTHIAPGQTQPIVTTWQKVMAFFAPQRQLALVRTFAVLLVIWLSLTSITVFAAADSLPGQPLYPVKLIVEDTQLRLTFAESQKAQFHLSLAEERLQETAVLIEANRTDEIANSLAAYQTEIETAVAFLEPAAALTPEEKESFAASVAQTLAAHETQLAAWKTELLSAQEFVAQALTVSQEAQSLASSLLGELLEEAPLLPSSTPTPLPTGTPEPPTPIPTPGWELPPFWPEECPSPLEWPDEWPEECTIPEEWLPDWPEPPGGWPVPPLPAETLEPPAGWTPPPYWPPECPIPKKWPFTWPEGCELPTAYPPDWTEPPGGWPELATPVPIPTVEIPSGWPAECPLPPDWTDGWEEWPDDCEIPTDFEWPEEWPTPPEDWPEWPNLPPPDEWEDSPDQLPPPPTQFPDIPDELPLPGDWPTPPPDDDDEPPPWPWP